MPKYSLTKKQRKTEQEQGRQAKPPSSTCVLQHNTLIQNPAPYSHPMNHQLKWVGRKFPTATGKSAG